MEAAGGRVWKGVGERDGIIVFAIEDVVGGDGDEGGVTVAGTREDVGMAADSLEDELDDERHGGFAAIDGGDEAKVALLDEVVEGDGRGLHRGKERGVLVGNTVDQRLVGKD